MKLWQQRENESGTERFVRGGPVCEYATYDPPTEKQRSAIRYTEFPDQYDGELGFRFVARPK